MIFRKSRFIKSRLYVLYVVVSGQKFTVDTHTSFPILDISVLSGDIRDRSLKLSEVDHNFAPFWPQGFLGEDPRIFPPDYKTKHIADHVAKCEGDRPMELGDIALKKRKE